MKAGIPRLVVAKNRTAGSVGCISITQAFTIGWISRFSLKNKNKNKRKQNKTKITRSEDIYSAIKIKFAILDST